MLQCRLALSFRTNGSAASMGAFTTLGASQNRGNYQYNKYYIKNARFCQGKNIFFPIMVLILPEYPKNRQVFSNIS